MDSILENNPEVDGDDSDLKECLLDTLRSDGTLKQIQDQLSAAVYSAYYRKTAQTPVQTQAKLTNLISRQNGLDALSILVDFLQALELKNTLNVLMHETGLDGLKLERREDLIRQYNVQSLSDNAPILPTLLDSVANQSVDPSKLHKAIVLDQDSDNANYNPNNGSIHEFQDRNNSYVPNSLSNDLQNQIQSSPQRSISSPTRSGTIESGRTLNYRDSYTGDRQSQLPSQKSSDSILPSENSVPSTNELSVSVPVSDIPTRNVVSKSTAVDRVIQPQTQQMDNEAHHNSYSSETDKLHTKYCLYTSGHANRNSSPPSNHCLDNEVVNKPASQVQQHENGDESDGSDIDSEGTTRRFRR